MKVSKRIIWLFAVLIVVSSLALFFFKVNEHFAEPNLNPKVSGCENDKIPNLKCDSGYALTGAVMKYGRWNNKICSHKSVNPKTAAISKDFVIPATYYKGKQDVTWGVSAPTLAGTNPYSGVYKHYEITGTCTPMNTTVTNSGCNGKKIPDLSCPNNYLVENATLKYGRWNDKGCSDKFTLETGTSAPVKTYSIDSNRYKGKRVVSLGRTADSLANKEDPAKGIKKQWEVTAKCKLNS